MSTPSSIAGPEPRALTGRCVIVTGGGRGIGRACALAAAAEGARVVVADLGCTTEGDGRDPAVAEAVAAEIRAAGGVAISDASDLSDAGAPERLVEAARTRLGEVTAVISCAGILVDRPALKTDAAVLVRVLSTHVAQVFGLLRAAAPAMIERKDGAFVWVTGASAFFGTRGHSADAAAHGATLGAMRSMALELRKHNVRVNAIVPSARTRLTEALPLYQSIGKTSLSPEHVAATAVYLASPAAHDVTGEILGVAGSRTYAFKIRETPGAFGHATEVPSVAAAGALVRDALRG